ncbi:MAG TPA: queuosine precursor transporter [Chitinophagales bacterium]|nr:queuosine precursor transporter [Chitinophagales bacterium]HMX05075.1 queuosine precursor transporter [Chitinophagales bacterium]HMZ88701.1 queuosine precursor transporter [Chitinophagales bacterium]HNA59154.1 queuosine precursor transporter [Chitinophagales bacterium]HNE45225.1 queuosine precursor transporter [Chitinophagales bacterium]
MDKHHHNPFASKPAILLLVLGVFFVVNAIIAEFIGVKVFALEDSLGLKPFNWNLYGQAGSLNFTVGVILWPFVFIMTDIINEYFGVKGVRRLSYLAVICIAYAFAIVYAGISLKPAAFWPGSFVDSGVPDMQAAYAAIFGQGMWIIGASIAAFLFSQIVDVFIFHRIKAFTGERRIWLRATGSTAISQIFDSLIVLYIAFVLGPQHWTLPFFFAVATVNYFYKILAAIVLTPVLYWVHHIIDNFLGTELSEKMRKEAMGISEDAGQNDSAGISG